MAEEALAIFVSRARGATMRDARSRRRGRGPAGSVGRVVAARHVPSRARFSVHSLLFFISKLNCINHQQLI